jgi:hypothetical protein
MWVEDGWSNKAAVPEKFIKILDVSGDTEIDR